QRGAYPAEGLERETEPAPHEEPGAPLERQAEPPVRYPVCEEEDVPRLLLHDAVEEVDQRLRKQPGVGREAEQPESEERIEALAVRLVELRPADVAHLVAVMRVDELPAEERLVLFGADGQLRH